MTNNKIFTNYQTGIGPQPDRFVKVTDCKHINTIGVIVHNLNSYATISALKGIKEATAGLGYELIVTHSQESMEKEAANARLLLNSRVIGVLASLSTGTKNIRHFAPFANAGIPTVFFDRVLENRGSDSIVVDNAGCGYQATEHLIRQGCKRIAIVTCGQDTNVYMQRYMGYRAALEKYGIPFTKQLLIRGNHDENAGTHAAGQIRQLKPMPDGLFITNDLVAAMCMQTLKEAGIRVPEDIAIVGFNNDPIGRLVFPTLTTVDYPSYDMGKAAALTLIGRLTNRRPLGGGKTTVIPSGLIIRNSSLKTTHAVA